MNRSEQALWDRIESFSIDEGDEALTFARRLARENGWAEGYAARTIEEYKRFMFLAVVAGHPVTPSDQVDQVWHLHLTYTRSYWDRFCGEVLKQKIHHGPTKGGPEEAEKFDRWYQNTLDSYRRFFDSDPPADLWPDASVRFGEDLHFERVNTRRQWVVRKPRLRGSAGAVALLAVLFSGGLVVGWQGQSPTGGEEEWGFAEFTFWAVFAAAVLTVSGVMIRADVRRRRCRKCGRLRGMKETGARGRRGIKWQCRFCGYDERRPHRGGGFRSGPPGAAGALGGCATDGGCGGDSGGCGGD